MFYGSCDTLPHSNIIYWRTGFDHMILKAHIKCVHMYCVLFLCVHVKILPFFFFIIRRR